MYEGSHQRDPTTNASLHLWLDYMLVKKEVHSDITFFLFLYSLYEDIYHLIHASTVVASHNLPKPASSLHFFFKSTNHI